MQKQNSFQWCSHCKENSARVKCYNAEGLRKRVLYCLNKGCGYKLLLPFPEEVEASATRTGQG